jgi:hypothetical protein
MIEIYIIIMYCTAARAFSFLILTKGLFTRQIRNIQLKLQLQEGQLDCKMTGSGIDPFFLV